MSKADINKEPVRAKVICVSRIKNEAWILKRFLETASVWADKIILWDQNWTDETARIISMYDKAIMVPNPREEYSETDYLFLLAEARKEEGKKLVVYLDADEFLSANITSSSEWQSVLYAREGSLINIRRIDFSDSITTYDTSFTTRYWFAFMDDGITNYNESKDRVTIHQNRLPFPNYVIDMFYLNDIVMLHYCNVDPKRSTSKGRFYQCHELLYSKKPPLSIVRQYVPGR